MTFAMLNLSPLLLKEVEAQGYLEPTPIQQQAVPIILKGYDLIGQAQTGTGKTAAFVLPLLERTLSLDEDNTHGSLILALTPTRELAIQVAESFKSLGGDLFRHEVCLLYGGQPLRPQLEALRAKPKIIVGTPGRVIDHLKRGSLHLKQLRSFVLDEADEMLKMGFKDEVEFILSELPPNRQSLLFSATMPTEIEEIAQRHLSVDHQRVCVKGESITSDLVNEGYLLMRSSDRFNALRMLLELENDGITLVFTRTRKETTLIVDRLQAIGQVAEALSGELTQNLREAVVNRLKDKRLKVVVATDVAARGLDIEGVSLVINYDVPYDVESYIHRVGRTGRAGQYGRAILLVTPRELKALERLESGLNRPLNQLEAPPLEELLKSRERQLVSSMKEIISDLPANLFHECPQLESYVSVLNQVRSEEFSAEKLALAALILASRERPLNRSALPPSISTLDLEELKRRSSNVIQASEGCSIAVLHSGKLNGVRPKDVVGAISHEAKLNGAKVGAIRIEYTRTLIELPNEYIDQVFRRLEGKPICGKLARFSMWDGLAEKVQSTASSHSRRGHVDQTSRKDVDAGA